MKIKITLTDIRPNDDNVRRAIVHTLCRMGFEVLVNDTIQTWTELSATGSPTKEQVDNAIF